MFTLAEALSTQDLLRPITPTVPRIPPVLYCIIHPDPAVVWERKETTNKVLGLGACSPPPWGHPYPPVLSPAHPPSDPHANPVTSALKLYPRRAFLSTSTTIISPPDSHKSPLTGLLAPALASTLRSPYSGHCAVLRRSAGHNPPVLESCNTVPCHIE